MMCAWSNCSLDAKIDFCRTHRNAVVLAGWDPDRVRKKDIPEIVAKVTGRAVA